MKVEGHDIVFASGNRVYCNQGIVGMGVEGPVRDVTEGYDGSLGETKRLSDLDLLELANHMIARWQSLRAEVIREAVMSNKEPAVDSSPQKLPDRCECCDYKTPYLHLVHHRRKYPHLADVDPHMICTICFSTMCGTAFEYPEQFPQFQVMRMLAYCTNSIIDVMRKSGK